MLNFLSHRILVAAASMGILLSGVGASYYAAAKPPSVINALIGSWRGSGTAKASSAANPESVNCKARYSLMPGEDILRVEVTCASANGKGLLVGFVHFAENSNTVTGNWYQKWSTSEGEENGSLTGTLSNTNIRLNISAAGKVRARLTMSPKSSRSHHVFLVGIVDGEEQQGMDITFKN